MLNTCGISEPMSLWMKFKESLCEDYYINARNIDADAIYTKDMYVEGLINIEDILISIGGNSLNNYAISSPNRDLHIPLKIYFKGTTYYLLLY